MDFITIDFETANSSLSSACSIGITSVTNLEISEVFYSLLNPRGQAFDAENISVHHITPDMVENSPALDDLWPEISRFFSPHVPVIAHNVHFDMSVLRLSSTADIPNFVYLDSMDISAPFVGGRKGLQYCVDVMNIPLDNHHNAASDAEATANLCICSLMRADCETIWEYIAKNIQLPRHNFCELVPQQYLSRRKRSSRKKYEDVNIKDICPTCGVTPNCSLLYGRSIVFTGQLSISRAEAMLLAVNAGAVLKSSVTKSTNYLVVGTQDPDVVGAGGRSSKEKRAQLLNDSGKAEIKIISESEFRALLN